MFKDYDTALKWAAQEMYSVAYDAPSINRMRDKPPPGTINGILDGLSRIDRHSQAANIVGKVMTLEDKACAEYLMVKYFLCDQCENLMINVMSAMGGGINRRAILEVVFEYCGRRKPSHRHLRSVMQIESARVAGVKNRIFERMDEINYRGSNLIDNVLIDAGIVNGGE